MVKLNNKEVAKNEAQHLSFIDTKGQQISGININKGLSEDRSHERFVNGDSVLGQHPAVSSA